MSVDMTTYRYQGPERESPDVKPSTGRDPLALFKPTKQVRAFEDVIAQIRALIADGHLEAGDKLPPERVLAAQLEVGRNTVREALRMLEISGIVMLKRGAHGGAFIADPEGDRTIGLLGRSLRFTDISIADLTQAMRSISMMLLDAAMPLLDETGFRSLEANIAEAERTTDPPARSAKIIRFYVLLAQISRNRVLVELAEAFCDILQSWVMRLGPISGETVIGSRRRIVTLLRQADLEGARRELDHHLDALHARWLSGDPEEVGSVSTCDFTPP